MIGSLSFHIEQHPQRSVLLYWGISGILGAIFLRDWIFAWNVPETLARPWLVALLVLTWLVSQAIYALVTDHQGRPFSWRATLLFAVGNGLFETCAFALVYRLGEVVGAGVVGWLFPSAAGVSGFVLGAILLMAYNGPVHTVFWLRILPSHFHDTPRARRFRPFLIPSLGAIVLAWSLCLWVSHDFWSVVLFHTLVDVVLMVKVRPSLFPPPASALSG